MAPGNMYTWTLHVHFGHCRHLFKVVVSSANVNTTTGNTLDVLYSINFFKYGINFAITSTSTNLLQPYLCIHF